MIVVNEKIHFHKKMVVVETEMHTDIRKVVADILESCYHEDVCAYGLEIDIDKILFISDSAQEEYIMKIDEEFFNDFKDKPTIKFPVLINVYPAYKITDSDLFDDNMFFDYRMMIVGFINNISDSVWNILKDKLHSTKSYVFGDSLIESPEYNNYFMKLLTNASHNLRLDPDKFRISDAKKVNIALNKLRKDATELTQLTNSSAIHVDYTDSVDISEIEEFLAANEDSLVIVPKRFFSSINSRLWTSSRDSTINIEAGDIFFNRYPFTLINGKKIEVIPAMSKVRIVMDNDRKTQISGRDCKLYDVIFTFKREFEDIEVSISARDVLIDFSSFLLNFSPDYHSGNMEEYDEVFANMEQYDFNLVLDPTILTLVPYRIVFSEDAKYSKSLNTLSYIERNERSLGYRSDTSWYKHFCKTLDNIYIRYADDFNE